MTAEEFKKIRSDFPKSPGVYRFINNKGVILYVGKAKNLRNRVSSYFVSVKNLSFGNNHTYRTRKMVGQATNIEYTIVDTEQDALLLETSFIKKFQPKYNVLLKDGKSYSYICVKREPFPRVFLTRRVIKDGSSYFGPYMSKYRISQILEIIKKLFQLRTCSLLLTKSNIENDKFNVCLEYHIKNCAAPCVGYESEEAYTEKINQISNILRGHFLPVKDYIKAEMAQYAEALEFERAQQMKEKLDLFENYQAKSTVVSTSMGNIDVFGYVEDEETAYVHYLKVVNGCVINTDTVELMKNMDNSKEDILLYAVDAIRSKFTSNAEEVIVPFAIDWVVPAFFWNVPQRGDKKKLLDLSMKNARYHQLQIKKAKVNRTNKETSSERILKTMQKDLQMDRIPLHIECFDNSNIQGTNPVSSCVVFKNAKPSKRDYRKFNIKTVVGPDDFASMKEVVYRRYRRLKAENQPLPDLVIIDGGKGQLSAAYAIFQELEIADKVTLIGIAKRLEEIFFPDDPIPLYINKKSETLKLIQFARNEAHRFAITFHRDQRSKNFIGTQLTDIKGVGIKTAQKLLKEFGTVNKIKQTDFDTLAHFVGKSIASKVYNFYREEE